MKLTTYRKIPLLLFGALFIFSCSQQPERERRVLVFSKTAAYRHESIEAGIEAMKRLGLEHKFEVFATEDASQFQEEVLKTFSAVIFLNTTGDVLDARQQAELERFIQAGGGFAGIHAATDTEYDWPWYGKLVGAYFAGHPAIQQARLEVVDRRHISTKMLPESWVRTDEWYNFKELQEDLHILINLDESSYEGGAMGEHHPFAWYHEYDGGRAFYTEGGHTEESYEEELFLQHLAGGIEYAIGENRLDYDKSTTFSLPEENRFIRTVLARNLDEPMELDMLPDGRILFIERKGAIKLYDPGEEKLKTVTTLPVHTEHEDGLLGLAIDPDYENNHWIYLCYSVPWDEPKQQLSRFVFKDDSLHYASEKAMLDIPVQREECCHSAGSLEFGPAGNLFISVGDNTNPFASDGFAPIDEGPGRSAWDAQRSSANTNDLRGKVLRIKPEAYGSYSIPKGNLFAPGTPNTRPEIYVMGCRNPFRMSIDYRRGYLFWGDVGPDAGKDGEMRGPKGIDEVNLAKGPGFWGWPYFRGNNQRYYDYNFNSKQAGELFDPQQPVNDSPNNTGLEKLPPSQTSLIWYSYDESEEFPWVKTGGKNPMAGPVFYTEDYENENKFPPYFDGKLIIYEWMRSWMYVIKIDSLGRFVKADPFMPNTEFSRPMDMIFGKDGSMYLLEYGQTWFAQNMDARLSRIDYIRGNRQPIAILEADKTMGAAPLSVRFSAANSIDYDGDQLSYEWMVDGVKKSENAPLFTHVFEREGMHKVELRVEDAAGNFASNSMEIELGNDPPQVAWTIDGNRTFFWAGRKVNYSVKVEDKEDGSSSDPGFDPAKVLLSFDYLPEGRDITEAAQGHAGALKMAKLARGAQLISRSDCRGCHAADRKVNGPSYREIARHYKGNESLTARLSAKVIKGGAGNWGESPMSAHPDLTVEQADEMVKYILSSNKAEKKSSNYPLKGVFVTDEHQAGERSGSYILMASYSDLGKGTIKPLTSRETIVLRSCKMEVEDCSQQSEDLREIGLKGSVVLAGMRHGSYFAFDQIDLTGIAALTLKIFPGPALQKATLEIRLNSPEGQLLTLANIAASIDEKGELRLPINPINGLQDVYFVLKNESEPGQAIAQPDWVYFWHAGEDI